MRVENTIKEHLDNTRNKIDVIDKNRDATIASIQTKPGLKRKKTIPSNATLKQQKSTQSTLHIEDEAIPSTQ